MTTAEIESFLAICRYKTITRAAEHLFISQSALSTRLNTLERDLGGRLFYRQKGCREMILTPKGKAFFALSVQYESIVSQMNRLCKEQHLSLRVSSINSLGSFLLPSVYEAFLQEYPDAELEIQDKELAQACVSIQRGLTDIAFTTRDADAPGVKSIHIFSEPMVLIFPKASAPTTAVTLSELSGRQEVYVPWCAAFEQWHREAFGFCAQPQISISIMEQLRLFMKRPGSWAIVPVSVANGMQEETVIVPTSQPLPHREVYCNIADGGEQPTALDPFLTCLGNILSREPQIEIKFTLL